MNLIEFPEQTMVIAKDQLEYKPMPAYGYDNDATGTIVCCWRLTAWERIKLLFTGKLWHSILTFHKAIQPQLLSASKPDMPAHAAAAPTEIKPDKTVRCGYCGIQFDPIDQWLLVRTNGGKPECCGTRVFCSKRCAEEFSSGLLGSFEAKPLSR